MKTRLIEGLWNCPYCNTTGNRGSIRECPNCGRARDENTKFYLPNGKPNYVQEEKAKTINRNPDWICPYCNSLNSDSDQNCKSCGSLRTSENEDYFSIKKKKVIQNEEKNNESQTSYTNPNYIPSIKEYKESIIDFLYDNWKNFIAIILTLSLLTGVVYLLIPKTEEIQITNFSWNRSIDIERYQTVNESNWSLPKGGRLQYTKNEIYTYTSVLDHYETKTREVAKERIIGYEEVVVGTRDLGNGYFEEITETRPIYETYYEQEVYEEPVYINVPVYRTKYYYEIDKWLYDRTLKTSAKNQNPYWEDVSSLPDNERVSNKSQKYYIIGINKKNKKRTISIPYEDWKTLNIGQKVKLKVHLGDNGELLK